MNSSTKNRYNYNIVIKSILFIKKTTQHFKRIINNNSIIIIITHCTPMIILLYCI